MQMLSEGTKTMADYDIVSNDIVKILPAEVYLD